MDGKGVDKAAVLELKGKKLNGMTLCQFIAKEAAVRNLSYVNLCGNKLSDDDMKPLEECLRNAKIPSVDLTKNKYTSRGLIELAQALKGNIYLQHIKLDSKRSAKNVVEAIEAILAQNRELRMVDKGETEELKMGGRGLKYFPDNLFKGGVSQLRRLDFSNNGLRFIPMEIVALNQLEILVLEDNLIKSVPLHLCQLSHLVRLRLRNNKIRKLPGELCMMPVLEDVDVRNNRITRVPPSLARKLKIIKISGNSVPVPTELQVALATDSYQVLDYLQGLTEQDEDDTEESEEPKDSTSSNEAGDGSEGSDTTVSFKTKSPRTVAHNLVKSRTYFLEAVQAEVKAGAVGGEDSLLDCLLVLLCYFDVFHMAVQKLLPIELSNLSNPELIFRADSFVTRLIVRYMVVVGGPYLNMLVSPVVDLILQEEVEIEVSPARVTSKKELRKNQERLLFLSTVFLNAVFMAKKVPFGICRLLQVVAQATNQYSPESVNACLGNFFFLRFLCPQIATVECKKGEAKRTIILITKLLQNLANEVHFTKESGMDYFDEFIDNNLERLHKFYREVTVTEGRPRSVSDSPFPIPKNAENASKRRSSLLTPRDASPAANHGDSVATPASMVKSDDPATPSSSPLALPLSGLSLINLSIQSSNQSSPRTPRSGSMRKKSLPPDTQIRRIPTLRGQGDPEAVREELKAALSTIAHNVRSRKLNFPLSPKSPKGSNRRSELGRSGGGRAELTRSGSARAELSRSGSARAELLARSIGASDNNPLTGTSATPPGSPQSEKQKAREECITKQAKCLTGLLIRCIRDFKHCKDLQTSN